MFNQIKTQEDFILDETMLQMPIKKSKQLQDLFKLKIQEKKLIEQFHNKSRAYNESLQSPKQHTIMDYSNPISSVQNQLKMNQSNSSYVVSCVLRALKYRKLAIDDISDIFGIEPQTIEQIDKFRRIQQLEGDMSVIQPNIRFEMKKDKLVKQLQSKLKHNKDDELFSGSSFTRGFKALKQSNFSLYNSRVSNASQSQLSSIIQSIQPREQDDNLFYYQKLLKNKPPHKLDDKMKAIIEIIKKHPNIMQKEIIQILEKDYNIKNITQTSVSRYYKKIYEMKKYCQILQQAKKDGFIDI